MAGIAATVLGALVKPAATVAAKHIERKTAKDGLKAKAQLHKVDAQKEITLTDAEWERASKAGENSSWKDEYLTIVITSPLVLILVGAIYGAFAEDMRLLDGTLSALEALAALNVDMGQLMVIVVMAGVSLKVWRQL